MLLCAPDGHLCDEKRNSITCTYVHRVDFYVTKAQLYHLHDSFVYHVRGWAEKRKCKGVSVEGHSMNMFFTPQTHVNRALISLFRRCFLSLQCHVTFCCHQFVLVFSLCILTFTWSTCLVKSQFVWRQVPKDNALRHTRILLSRLFPWCLSASTDR